MTTAEGEMRGTGRVAHARSRMWIAALFATIAVALLAATAAHAGPIFTLTDLGDLPGGLDSSSAAAINNVGQVTGLGASAANNARPWLWTPTTANGTTGAFVDIGDAANSSSFMTSINDRGQVGGWTAITGGGAHATVWTPNTPNGSTGMLTDLGLLPGTGTQSRVESINVHGQAVGLSYVSGQVVSHPFLWQPTADNATTGTMYDLGVPTGSGSLTSAIGVNDVGQVLISGGYVWQPTTPNGHVGSIVSLSGMPAGSTGVSNINNAGQVTHSGNVNGVRRWFRWSPSTPNGTVGSSLDLGSIAGFADYSIQDMNGPGNVVGYAVLSALRHAWYWTPQDGMLDLNTMIDGGLPTGVTLREARGINDSGQIIGVGTFGSTTHAFLLTPIPEPACTTLLALAGAALAGQRRRRRCSVG
jgi:hypothetical protein